MTSSSFSSEIGLYNFFDYVNHYHFDFGNENKYNLAALFANTVPFRRTKVDRNSVSGAASTHKISELAITFQLKQVTF